MRYSPKERNKHYRKDYSDSKSRRGHKYEPAVVRLGGGHWLYTSYVPRTTATAKIRRSIDRLSDWFHEKVKGSLTRHTTARRSLVDNAGDRNKNIHTHTHSKHPGKKQYEYRKFE